MSIVIDGREISHYERELLHTCMMHSTAMVILEPSGREIKPDFLEDEDMENLTRLANEIKGE